MNYWFALLNEWRLKNKDGFTIPFIIGSQKYLHTSHSTQSIEELLTDILLSDTATICIKYCITTEDIILEILDEKKNLIGVFPSYKGQSQTKLFLTQFLYDLGEDCETIIATLSDRYSGYIKNGEYSLNDRQRGDYCSNEKDFIKEVFVKNQLSR